MFDVIWRWKLRINSTLKQVLKGVEKGKSLRKSPYFELRLGSVSFPKASSLTIRSHKKLWFIVWCCSCSWYKLASAAVAGHSLCCSCSWYKLASAAVAGHSLFCVQQVFSFCVIPTEKLLLLSFLTDFCLCWTTCPKHWNFSINKFISKTCAV